MTLDDLEGHWQPVWSAISAGLFVTQDTEQFVRQNISLYEEYGTKRTMENTEISQKVTFHSRVVPLDGASSRR